METRSPVEVLGLLTSAAYVNAEIGAEFGHLPPSFLPFGHDRLFVSQIRELRKQCSRVVMTIPDSYRAFAWDRAKVTEEAAEVLPVPEGLSLGESIAYALTLCDAFGPVRILHGDTLFLEPLTAEDDVVGVSHTTDEYAWGAVEPNGRFAHRRPESLEFEQTVLTGWFSLSSSRELLKSLALNRGDFVAALNTYGEKRSLKSVQTPGWLDFGHLQTFNRSRARASTSRSFNSVIVSGHTVVKRGQNTKKLQAEAQWYTNIPPDMRLHTPPFLGEIEGGYRIAYENNPTLHELYVFGALNVPAWRQILSSCVLFLEKCASVGSEALEATSAIEFLALDKTRMRLERWAYDAKIDLTVGWQCNGKSTPSLSHIASEAAAVALSSTSIPGVMHGDFCFPNTFYDFRTRIIKVIDPRGGISGEPCVMGDLRYDLAKLNHSVEGYDFILAGRYSSSGFGSRDVSLHFANEGAAAFLPDIASELALKGQRLNDRSTLALTIHLFLSMLPLHADRPDRQYAFLANALRLYQKLEAVE